MLYSSAIQYYSIQKLISPGLATAASATSSIHQFNPIPDINSTVFSISFCTPKPIKNTPSSERNSKWLRDSPRLQSYSHVQDPATPRMVQAPQNHNVAIIGMSCQLPCGVNDAYDLWDFCARARCAAGPIPRTRFNAAQFYHPDRNKRGHFNTEAGSFLELDVAVFDAPFFNISEAEAKSLDPQHRLMLQTAFLALENAGIDLASISGRGDVGVFASGSPSEYEDRSKLDPYTASAYVATSTAMTMFANRISYFLNLKGPSITVDTACSSALTALHLAAESIRRGECSCAIVGGSSLQLSPHTLSFFANLGTLSKDGISFSFDHRANGYGRGEGSVCIILKAVDHAVLDNDCIRALVRGSGVNHVGRSQGITLPDGQSQADLITRVYEQAGLDPNDTTYVEAHGTGTERGDPIEAESIALALKTKSRGPENSIYVGSIKSNFGHLEVVSGLVSIVKCVMMLEQSTILPNANFEKTNPAVNLHHLNISIPIECIPWPEGLRRASVNNFGFGGSNAHVILEQTPDSPKSPEPGQVQRDIIPTTSQMPVSKLFILCAKDRTSLQSYVKPLIEWLSGPSRDDSVLRDMSYTLCCRRTQFPYRFATYASTSAELIERLQGNAHIGRLSSTNKAAFIFTGQGAEWPQMGMSLMQYPTFANEFQKAEESLKRLGAEWSLFDEISKSTASSHMSDAILSQPAVTALQISLVSLLRKWNINPTAVCGHSSGEIAAAFAAGFLDLNACMALAYYRGEAASQLSKSSPTGAMMAVGASPAYVESCIACLQNGFATIACFNSPKSVTVSGDRAAILELSSKLDRMGVFHRMLKVNVAYHSDQMISVAKHYLRKIKGVINRSFTQTATSCFYSSVNGKAESGRIVASPWYWVTNLVSPVQFSKAVGSLLSDSDPDEVLSFIEIGPHSALQGPLRDIVNGHKGVQKNENGPEYFPTLKRNEDACENLLELGASLLNRGFDLNTPAVFSDTSGSSAYHLLPNLPQYRFNTSKRYWHETRLTTEMEQHGSAWNMLLGHRVTGTVGDTLEFRNVFSLDDIPWLRDHQVNGETIFPAAGYISMAIEAVRFSSLLEQEQVGGGYSIREMTIGRAFHLPEAEQNEIFTVLRPRRSGTRAADSFDWFSFQIFSWRKENGFSEHCSGLISVIRGRKADEITQLSLQLTREKWIRQLCNRIDDSSQSKISPESLYHQLKRVGLSYGPAFAQVSSLRTGDDCAVGTVRCEDTSSCMPLNYETPLKVHPTTFDALLHVGLCNLGGNKGLLGGIRAHIPIFLKELFISDNIKQCPGDEIGIYMHDPVTERMARTTTCSLTCFSPGIKDPIVEIRGLRVFDVDEEGSVPSLADTINPLTIDWRDHPDFIGSDCLVGWKDPEVGTTSAEADVKLLDQQAYYLIKSALSVSGSKPDQSGHLSFLRKWMDAVVCSIESDENISETKNWVALRGTERENFVNNIARKSFQGQFNSNVGQQLPAILAGQADAPNVLFQRDGLWRVYEESMFFSRSNRQLAQLVAHLAHQNPSLRILEVGAGTGGLTSKILTNLTSTTTGWRQYEVYDYTDISTGFFENARSKFECFEGVNFKKFDVSKDPAGQGFLDSYYDLIVAMDVIHAIPSVADGLQNMRKLLKPNGVLALVELNQFRLHLFPFATLPGWWLKEDGPIIGEKEWNELLLTSGYTGIEAAIDDFPNVDLHKVYWTHANKNTNPLLPRIHLIQSAEISLSSPLTEQVCAMFRQRFGQDVNVLSLAASGYEKGIFILLDQAAELLLSDMDNTRFEALKTIFSRADDLIWVTRSSNPKTRFVSGFCRTLQLEYRQLRLAVLHLDATDYTHSASSITRLCEHLYRRKSDGQDRELEFREVRGHIQIPRLVPAKPPYDFIESDTNPALTEEQNLLQKDRCLELTIGTVGLFSTLFFQDSNLGTKQLGDDEVLIEIEAIGLNFKDVMIALGSLPWQGLGREASSIVIATGKRAQLHFPIGSRVLHWGDGLFATHARGDISNIVKMPAYMTFEEAASVPVVYTTAFEALVNLGRLQKDERVLIHAAAGGVGQAAIMVAQWIGAEIFCTVGSLEKKELIMQLYSIPDDHIFSSRSPAFAQSLLMVTDMAGVDVILNSLAGEMLRVSWQCIAKLGRFIDISKRDAVANTNLEMAPFDKGVTYTALDLSLYSDKGNKNRKKLTTDVLKLFDIKAVRPVYPLNVLPMSDLESGLRAMQMGKHMGKIVIRNGRDTLIKVQTRSSNSTKLRPDASYIITGGAGGLGLFLSQWFLQNGARNIILASRSARTIFETKTMRDMLKTATDLGGTVLPVPCDVGSLADVQSIVALAVERGMPPIRGVIHGAMVLRDAMFETTTLEDWQSVIKPKVQGAINLHQVLANEPLDFFICLSSVVGTLGNAGQTSYAGSNSFMDSFCQWRTSQGLPGTSIALPAVSDVRYVARMAASNPSSLQASDLYDFSITGEQVGHLIKAAINSHNFGSHIVAGISISSKTARHPRMQDPLLSQVWTTMGSKFAKASTDRESGIEARASNDPIVDKESLLQATDIKAASKMVYQALAQKIAKDMMLSPQDITLESSLSQIGLDSLVAVEFRNWLAKELDANIRVMEIINSRSMNDLVATVVQKSSILARIQINGDQGAPVDDV